jgi:endonuclease/exonuclease/phosphatase family metal-dependent hydrolase
LRRRRRGRETAAVATVRICSVNAEWMNDWFTADSGAVAFRKRFTRDGQDNDTATTAGRLAAMIESLDADVIALEEGPSRLEELELFVQRHLGGAYGCFLSAAGGQQKLALLHRTATVDSAALVPADAIPELTQPWDADIDGDAVLDEYAFTRTPLVVDLVIAGEPLQVVVAHTKSNFINRGRELWENEATRQQYVVGALENRRRISSEGMAIRRYLDRRLQEDPDAPIIVLGDLNDGPGMDYFEEKYLSHNVTDIIVGSAFTPERAMDHAQHDVPADQRYTAVFEDFVPVPQEKHLLLDHIMLSPGLLRPGSLHKVDGSGAVRHAEYEAQVAHGGKRREDRPSDHRPVSVDLATG